MVNNTPPNSDPSEAIIPASSAGFQFDKDKQNATLALLGTGFVVLMLFKTLGAVLDVVDDFWLLPEFFQMVGLGWTIWFATNKLLFKEDRQTLGKQFKTVKQAAVGDWSPIREAKLPVPLPLPAVDATPLDLAAEPEPVAIAIEPVEPAEPVAMLELTPEPMAIAPEPNCPPKAVDSLGDDIDDLSTGKKTL